MNQKNDEAESESDNKTKTNKNEEDQIAKPIQEPEKYRYLIVGGGTAGYAAMKAILQEDPMANILIVTEEMETPYRRPPLSKELWKGRNDTPSSASTLKFTDWSGKEQSIFYETEESWKDLLEKHPGLNVEIGHKVDSLNAYLKRVTLDDGRRVEYDRICLATGGTPVILPFQENLSDEISPYVQTFRNVTDFKQLESLTRKKQKVVIIGGGFLGSELASGISGSDLKVSQVYPEVGILGHILPKYLSNYLTRLFRKNNVEEIPNHFVTKIIENPNKSESGLPVAIELDNGDLMEASLIVVAAGMRSNSDLAVDAGLEIDQNNGGIVVNSDLESRRDVFAAGDVISYYDIVLGRRRVEHYDHAFASGVQAGKNMVSGNVWPYLHQSMFWSDLYDSSFEAVGELDSNLETVSFWANDDVFEDKKDHGQSIKESEESEESEESKSKNTTSSQSPPTGIVYYLRNEKVVGVLLWNVSGKVEAARRLIQRQERFKDLQELSKEIGF